jgi:chromosomal replication initiator protein
MGRDGDTTTIESTGDAGRKAFHGTLELVRRRVSRQQYETWFSRVDLLAWGDDGLVVGVPNRFFRDWMSKKFRPLVAQAALDVTGRRADVRFEVAAEPPAPTPPAPVTPAPAADRVREPMATLSAPPPPAARPAAPAPAAAPPAPLPLHPTYTFDDFVIGPSNQMAHAKARAVADDPGGSSNPLFLYGGVGLGKTHLLQAICHEVLRRSPDFRIVYLSCEEFTNEYVSAVQRNATEAFRNRFRSVDMLVIDDIHFLANKERTQEEFFHTFNALYQARRQIVLSSDAPPADIPSLQERLVSRFKWGLVEKVEPPETETRMAILRQKAESWGLQVPNDVIDYVASNVRSNIREIEGALASIRSRSQIQGVPVDLALAKAALEPTLSREPVAPTLDQITQIVATHFGVKVSDLRSKKRTKSVSFPRQLVMWIAREETPLSLEEIGDHFGGRDHTTVLYATTKVGERIAQDDGFRTQVDRLRDRLHARS